MSVVVAVCKKGQIAIAADTQINFGDVKLPNDNHKAQKVRKVGNSYIAKTGWAIYENVFDDFMYKKKVPQLTNEKNIYSFFLKLWKKLHEKYAFINDQCNEKDTPFGDLDASFLVVNKKGIFHVAADMSVSKFEKYFAIGSGDDFALGALHALYNEKYDSKTLAGKAVEAAIAFKTNCGGDIETISV